MIDFGLVTLFALQCGLVFAVFFAWSRVKAEITALMTLKEGITSVTAKFEALKESFQALERRQGDVEGSPRALLLRFQEMEANLGKADRNLEKLESKVASLGGRMSAIVKGRKGRGDDEDDEEKGLAAQAEGILPDGVGIPLGPQNERPANQVIPPGFGKSARRTG